MERQTREREQMWLNGIDPDPVRVEDSDVAITPQWVADWLGGWATLDPCGHPAQLVRARRIVCPPDDGLIALADVAGARVWCNPPYSRPLPWALAIVAATVERQCSSVSLLRADVTTTAARVLIDAARAYGGWVGLTRTRLRFGRVDVARDRQEAVFGGPAPFGGLLIAIGRYVPPPPERAADGGHPLILGEYIPVVCRTSVPGRLSEQDGVR